MNRLIGPADTDSRSLESEIIRLRNRLNRAESRLGELEERFHGLVFYSVETEVTMTTAGTYVDLPFTGTLNDLSVGAVSAVGKLGLKNVSQKAVHRGGDGYGGP